MPLQRVDNEYLFRRLAVRLGATLVCDVGAFDGTHAKRFQRAGLRVIAFEANPHCFAALASDPSIDAAGIHLVKQQQRLGADVVAALRELGFTPIARGPGGDLQFDVVFVNDRWLRAARFAIRTCLAQAFARAAASALRGRLRRLLRSA